MTYGIDRRHMLEDNLRKERVRKETESVKATELTDEEAALIARHRAKKDEDKRRQELSSRRSELQSELARVEESLASLGVPNSDRCMRGSGGFTCRKPRGHIDDCDLR